jgi:hypothetical protein
MSSERTIPVGDELLRTAEVAQLMRVPMGTLRQWRHRGIGPKGFRLGGRVVYRRSAVEAFIATAEAAEQGQAAQGGAA